MKNKPFHHRLRYALAGIRDGWRLEKSFRTHAFMGAVALTALCILRPRPMWWALVVLTTALVMALELINAALEALIDHLHPDLHPQIRVAKDMAAGSVLLLSGAALVVALAMVVDAVFFAR